MEPVSTVAVVDMDIRSPEGDVPGGDGGVRRLDCYDLGRVDLSPYAGLVFPPMVDQEHLGTHRGVIEAYLDRGGVVVFGGHLHRPWLPGAGPFVPLPRPSLGTYRVAEVADHPIFSGVEADDLTFRRGVAGFFARGHHPLPPGAEALTRLAGGEPATYLDRVSTAGTILVQASSDLLRSGSLADDTAGRLPGQLLDWVRATAARPRVPPLDLDPPAGAPLPVPAATTAPPAGGLAALYGGSSPAHRTLTAAKYARHLTGGTIYLPDLADVDLTGLAGLIIPERMHRGLLERGAERILDLLDAGGVVVAFSGGEPLPGFLPGVRFEPRPTNFWWWLEAGADLGLRTPSPRHRLFDHIGLADCAWHYHGVLDPPAGADVLVTLATGEPVLYVDSTSTNGTLVVATLDPISHYGSYFMPATERFLDGFLPWLSEVSA
jgi:hypothetical protein